MSKSKVMIVDDDNLMLQITGDALEEAGFDVIRRSNPLGTTAAIRKESPDCIIVDVNMPGLSGDRLVELIKKNSKINIKIILHSDRAEVELQKIAEESGADGFIKKDGDHIEMLRKVQSLISN